MTKVVQVFSPHFDDATLSCGEHILRWLDQGYRVEVVTVFSEFEAKHLSQDSQDFMDRCGVSSAKEFQAQRGQEDKESMKLLGASHFEWLGQTDGGFREENSAPTYASHTILFEGKILDSTSWKSSLKTLLQKHVQKDATVIVPLGVGQHADHLLIKQQLQQLVPVEKLGYYVDIPYALQLSKWSTQQLKELFFLPKSLVWSSERKLKAVRAYNSQVPLLFQDGLWQYPECVVGLQT